MLINVLLWFFYHFCHLYLFFLLNFFFYHLSLFFLFNFFFLHFHYFFCFFGGVKFWILAPCTCPSRLAFNDFPDNLR
jgi:hypothetical protein